MKNRSFNRRRKAHAVLAVTAATLLPSAMATLLSGCGGGGLTEPASTSSPSNPVATPADLTLSNTTAELPKIRSKVGNVPDIWFVRLGHASVEPVTPNPTLTNPDSSKYYPTNQIYVSPGTGGWFASGDYLGKTGTIGPQGVFQLDPRSQEGGPDFYGVVYSNMNITADDVVVFIHTNQSNNIVPVSAHGYDAVDNPTAWAYFQDSKVDFSELPLFKAALQAEQFGQGQDFINSQLVALPSDALTKGITIAPGQVFPAGYGASGVTYPANQIDPALISSANNLVSLANGQGGKPILNSSQKARNAGGPAL